MTLLTSAIFILALIHTLRVVLRFFRRLPPVVLRDTSAITRLLSPSSFSLSSLLESRARANARFVRAFEINSTFTSPSSDVHVKFVKYMKDLVSITDWTRVSDAATSAIGLHVQPGSAHTFDKTVRVTVLHVVLVTFLRADPMLLELEKLDRITIQLNHLWTLSKSPVPIPSHLLQELNAQLRTWVPHVDNPLEIIIPTYETMWRVVAVTIAYAHRDTHLRSTFMAFHDCPTLAQFRDNGPEGSPSAKAVIHEVLRLYPPTRRISRHVPRDVLPAPLAHLLRVVGATLPSPSPTSFVADVEAAQRDPAVWGPDAHVFDPHRWAHIPEGEWTSRLLSFGHGRLRCIASTWAPGAAAAIAAAVLAADVDVLEGKGAITSGREGWQGWRVGARGQTELSR